MPQSIRLGKDKIKSIINYRISSSNYKVLDLGCGKGTYGRLIEKPCYKVAVDAVDYSQKYKLSRFYNEFHQMDIRNTQELKALGVFNIIIAGDVLEHMSFYDARKVLTAMKEMSELCIIAVPYLSKQHLEGNKWEEHIQSDLTPEIMQVRYPELELIAMYNRNKSPWNGKPAYAYYWCKGDLRWQDQELK